MTGPIASLNAALRWDLSDFDRGTRHIEMSFQRLLTLGRDMAAGFKQIGQRMTLGITAPLIAIGAYTVNAASDLQELQSAFDYTFGASAATMNAWAESTGNAMGRATSEMKAGALAMGQLFKQAAPTEEAAARLSQRFTALAQDAASFYNTSFDEALGKIRSGLSGESEPLRDFGVFLTEAAVKAKALEMGLADLNGVLSEQSKIIARAALIQEGLADATGDVERTAGSFANRVRALKANIQELAEDIGERFLPYAETFVGWAATAVEWIGKLPSPIKDIAVAFGAMAAAIGPLLLALVPLAVTILPLFLTRLGPVFFAISALINPIGTLIISLGKLPLLWTAVGAAFAKWGPTIVASLTPVSAAVMALKIALGYLVFDVMQANAEIASLGVSLEQSNDSLARAIERARSAGVDIDKLGAAGKSATSDFFGLAKAFKMASDAAADLASNAKLAQLAVLNQTRAEQQRKIVLLEQKVGEARAAQPFGVVSDALRKIDPIGDGSIERARSQSRKATEMELSAARLALENLNREIAVTAATPDKAFNRPNPEAVAGAGGGGARSSGGAGAYATASNIEKQRRLLELRRNEFQLEQDIALARERGDGAAERKNQRELDISRRAAEYRQLEYDDTLALEKATADIAAIEAARTAEMAKQIVIAERDFDLQIAELRNDYSAINTRKDEAYLEERIAFWKSKQKDDAEALLLAERDRAELLDAMAESAERQAARDEDARQIELARLRGDDPRSIRALEEGQRIRDRADELQRTLKMKPEDALAQAVQEGAERSRAALTGTFRDTFRAGLQAAMNGDLGEFFKNWIETRAFDALAKVLDRLADQLANLVSGGGGGGGLLGAVLGLAGSAAGLAGNSKAVGSAASSIGNSAARTAKSAAIPRFNTGGWGTIKGFPGIDTNVLSLNDNPIAMVSSGELLNVQKAGDGAARAVQAAVRVVLEDTTGLFKTRVETISGEVASGQISAARPAIAADGAAAAVKRITRMQDRAL